MQTIDIDLGAEALNLCWPDGKQSSFPYIWLMDNDPAGLHPDTKERVTDLLTMPRAEAAVLDGPDIHVTWREGGEARFPLSYLAAHIPGDGLADPAAVPAHTWTADLGAAGVPRHTAEAITRDDTALLHWLKDTAAYGLSIVEGVEPTSGAGLELAQRIGFLRQTNFGVSFEVVNKPDPNNLAYTALALPLHTDLTNQEVPPGYQFLHCIANEAEGGGSVFADGVAMAEALRAENPEAFELLSTVAVPFRFHDAEVDIRSHHPVINLTHTGAVHEIKWNAHLAAVFDMEPGLMTRYYRAYRSLMTLTRDPAYQLRLKLKAGEMAVFDNRRVLHGRDAFDPSTGFRHLQGCYVDRGEFLSRIRILSRAA